MKLDFRFSAKFKSSVRMKKCIANFNSIWTNALLSVSNSGNTSASNKLQASILTKTFGAKRLKSTFQETTARRTFTVSTSAYILTPFISEDLRLSLS